MALSVLPHSAAATTLAPLPGSATPTRAARLEHVLEVLSLWHPQRLSQCAGEPLGRGS